MRSSNPKEHHLSPCLTPLGLALALALGCPVGDDGRGGATEPTSNATGFTTVMMTAGESESTTSDVMTTSDPSATSASTSAASDSDPSTSGGSAATAMTDPDPTTTEPDPTTSSTTGTDTSETTSVTDPDVCGDGVVTGDEPCDDGNGVNDDECSNACERPRLVFITKTVYKGDLAPPIDGQKGLALADAHCQLQAELGGAVGTFRAWLSDSTGSPSTRFDTSFTGAYKLVDGTVIAAEGWDDLTDGTLAHPIDRDPMGAYFPADAVLTNTQPNGLVLQADGSCDDWSSASPSLTSVVGFSSSIGAQWTANRPNLCSVSDRLYCFEDAPTSG